MGLKSFKSTEESRLFTALNIVSGVRAIGGAALGVALARNGIDPGTALVYASALAASDAEGLLITATNRFPRTQRALRIIPSTLGRKIDPIADKIFAVSVLTGGAIGGSINPIIAGSILTTELATAAATGYVIRKGGDPETSQVGTWGMAGRCGAIALSLAASATEGQAHDVLFGAAVATAATSVVLGAISCRGILRDTEIPAPAEASQP